MHLFCQSERCTFPYLFFITRIIHRYPANIGTAVYGGVKCSMTCPDGSNSLADYRRADNINILHNWATQALDPGFCRPAGYASLVFRDNTEDQHLFCIMFTNRVRLL